MDGEKILGKVNNRIKPEGSKNPTSTLFYPPRDSDIIGLGGEVWLLFSFESSLQTGTKRDFWGGGMVTVSG